MKTLHAILLTTFISFAASGAVPATDRLAQWKKVDEAINKGLPKTAIAELEPVIKGALADKAWGEAAKAIARKIALEGAIEGNKPEEKIPRLEAEIGKAPREMKPLLWTIQANWYWHYFQHNRWRFMQRTATAQAPGKDFTTWDLPRLFAEIDRQFQAALADGDTSKKTPVSAFDDILEKGALPDRYRPTLYDFIAHDALKFYTSGEQAAAKPEDAFELPASGPIFEGADVFLKWWRTFAVKSFPDSPVVKALDLYGRLLAFHENDKDPSAFADADLARLQLGHNTAFGEEKAARYKTSLKAFAEKYADHELSAVALHRWAGVVKGEGNFVEARELAMRGKKSFPESPGGKLCHNLIQDIESKSAAITTERVWNAPMPKIAVRYRNVTQVFFRAVSWDWNEFLAKDRSRPEWLNDRERKELLSRKPALQWSAKLPPTPDFKERTERLPAPASLKPGHYFIVSSHDANFGETDNQISYTNVWVSDLALVVVTHEAKVEGFVLEAASGEPIADAEVVAWHLDRGVRVPHGTVQTGANGCFSFPTSENRTLLLRARARGQEIGSQEEYRAWRHDRTRVDNQGVFFTDRAIYRPGQTVSYKGILIRVDQKGDNYETLAGRRVEVIFHDPNGKEVAKTTHTTSDYGSFTGSFTAPRDRVMGNYQIRLTSGGSGATSFSVEEYKRPKFQVTLDAPKTAPKLNDKVNLQGRAEAHTGAAVDGAKVKWRVVREVRWPYWWHCWGWRGGHGRGSESQEVAHGTAVTAADGAFKIEFTAKPDPQVEEKSEASFCFRVYADVTDTAGETRSADRGVNVGFTALSARVEADDWQTDGKPVELKIRTGTLDDEPQAAKGVVKVHRLKEPRRVQRPPLAGHRYYYSPEGDGVDEEKDQSDPNNWPLGGVVNELKWNTDAEGKAAVSTKLGAGVYRAMLETQDRFGRKVTARAQITVLQLDAERFAIKLPHRVAAPKWQAEPGDEFMALWGTGYDAGRAFVEIEHRRQMIQRYWTQPGATQQQIKLAVTEAMRGGFTIHITQIRENRAYLASRRVDVPWSNKDMAVKWEHFTSKLQPGQKETWSAVITGPKARKSVAEMVATLCDESLDAYRKHEWLRRLNVFYNDHSDRRADFGNIAKQLQHVRGGWRRDYLGVDMRYRDFPADLVANIWGYGWDYGGRRMMKAARGGMVADGLAVAESMAMPAAAAPAPASPPMEIVPGAKLMTLTAGKDSGRGGEAGGEPHTVDLSKVAARRNLNETAFFFPQLISDANGVVRMTFTMPEALTSWRFLGFAHDRACRSGFLEGHAVTAKDLMVQPNPPRFLREGDTVEFAVKVSNQSAARQTGTVRLTFSDAATEQSADKLLGNAKTEQEFDIPSKESHSFAWRIKAPDGAPFLAYKAVAATARLSDGEEGAVPVLSRRMLVTESLPLPIRGPATKKFEFSKLVKSGQSSTLQHQSLTVQMVSNPSWYAVMALPYLMEFPHECTEQTFNRLYANALARSIANADPKIRRIFDLWKGTPALDSPLEKNQDLKSVMIEETPWLRQAQAESQARRNVGILFDANRLDTEFGRVLRKLAEAQNHDGAWPWFPGGHGNDYITLYIVTGFGRLRHLGVEVDVACAVKALARLDNWMDEHYRRILTWPDSEKYVPSSIDALYLYGRSFFLKDRPIAKNHQAMANFFLGQTRKHWLKVACRQSQGHLAIASKRFGGEPNGATAQDIMKSIEERSVTNEEMGMFWRETELSWWWYRAPIETQALMIEAFDEVMGDAQAVEECRVWLLKQKQTQDWKTTKATADAVYALLLRGKNILASDKLVEVTVGGVAITPGRDAALRRPPSDDKRPAQRAGPAPAVEAGTGFHEKRFAGADVKPKLGEVTVKKADDGVAWGSVHWQYLEDMTKITPHEGTPLKLKKSLHTKVATKKGPVLEPVRGAIAVGDELVVRIELRVDRDMEYVHLKDQRGSGTEPVNVLSRYKFQDGLAYYESTRDTASHFFIDYLPKGAYVFEYSTRVQLRGAYQTGVAEIQCMYAPEFNSHSESLPLTVK